MEDYVLSWAPEGCVIATLRAKSPQAAKKRTPRPYKRYRGEVGVETLEAHLQSVYADNPDTLAMNRQRLRPPATGIRKFALSR